MVNLLPTTRRNIFWLTSAVVSVAAGLLLLAVLLPLAALAATLTLALLVGLTVVGQIRAQRRTLAARSRATRAGIQPAAQRTIYAADGSTRQALLVPIPQTDDFELVLTIEGYALVDESGRVVYRMK